jgi:hypothetical protein
MADEKDKTISLKFDIIKENWNEYELSDGVTIKIRIILMKIYRQENDKKGISLEFSQPLIAIFCPPEKMGDKNNQPKPEEYDILPKEPIEILKPIEYWNEYRIGNSSKTLRIKYMASEIERISNRFNSNGEPFYLIDGGPFVETSSLSEIAKSNLLDKQ